MMQYIEVEWHHEHPNEPVLLYSELDSDRWEIRKVEIYRDGRADFADLGEAKGTTKLAIEPLPSIEDIASDRQFTVTAISKEEFEQVWRNRKHSS